MGLEIDITTGDTAAKPTAHHRAYQQLRGMVLFGDLAPGQAVTIQGLIDLLDAGMTPVREALRRLTSEGALIQQGNRRVSVPVLTADCVSELGFMRKNLEPELARRAARLIDSDDLTRLVGIDEHLNSAIARGDVGGYLTQNYRFHAEIYRVANAPIMTATVDRLWMRFGPSLRVVCGRSGTQNLPDKHAELLAALARNDIPAAAHAMAQDVEQGMRQIKSALGNIT